MEVTIFNEPGEGPRLVAGQTAGHKLYRSSRTDEHGRYFMTRWYRIYEMPIKPTRRYYGKFLRSYPWNGTTKTEYEIVGSAELDWRETVRAYLTAWVLMPFTVLVPALLFIIWADSNEGLHGLVVIGVPLALFFGFLALNIKLVELYYKYLAPIHTPILATGHRAPVAHVCTATSRDSHIPT